MKSKYILFFNNILVFHYFVLNFRIEKANRMRLIDKKMKSITKSNRQAPIV